MSRPNQEAIAAANLARQGYDYYYPRIKQAKPGRGTVIVPLFSRYLFIFIVQRWYSICGTHGLSHILMNEGGPNHVDGSIITAIREREGPDGYIQLIKPPKYRRNQRIRIEAGPFQGHFAIYDSMTPHERCRVLLDWLGSKVKVDMSEGEIAAA